MKHEIYGHPWPVSTHRFSAAKYGLGSVFPQDLTRMRRLFRPVRGRISEEPS